MGNRWRQDQRRYAWIPNSGLDRAVVHFSQVNFHDLEGSAGVGFRFNVQNSVFLRIDAGFSREGAQIWLKFENVF